MTNAGFSVVVISSTCEEPPHPEKLISEKDIEIVTKIANVKCSGGIANIPASGNSSLVLGADTLVFCDDTILGKPKDRSHAESMLQLYSGKTHSVATGVVVKLVEAGKVLKSLERTVISKVKFRAMNRDEIHWYLDQNEYQDKAGAYGIQGKAEAFVESIDGSFSNIVGLPLSTTLEMIEEVSERPWQEFVSKDEI